MKATFICCFEDIDYESWTRKCGLEFIRFEPRRDGCFELHVHGNASAIAQFAGELGWQPRVQQ